MIWFYNKIYKTITKVNTKIILMNILENKMINKINLNDLNQKYGNFPLSAKESGS